MADHAPFPLKKKASMVYLVGAGPGDPGLLTMRAARAISMADVLLYDHLIPLELLDMAPDEAKRIDVGKVRNHPRMSQKEIGETLVEHARQGLSVVRLKGGDPFVFGRGGEEAQVLAEAGIPFIVIPGVTSPVAVPAYSGIPVTHRDHSSRLIILTAHDDPTDWKQPDIDALARPHQTVVVLMGALYMKELVARLLNAGLDPKTPTAIIRWGTTPNQESYYQTLEEIPAFLKEHGIAPPSDSNHWRSGLPSERCLLEPSAPTLGQAHPPDPGTLTLQGAFGDSGSPRRHRHYISNHPRFPQFLREIHAHH